MGAFRVASCATVSYIQGTLWPMIPGVVITAMVTRFLLCSLLFYAVFVVCVLYKCNTTGCVLYAARGQDIHVLPHLTVHTTPVPWPCLFVATTLRRRVFPPGAEMTQTWMWIYCSSVSLRFTLRKNQWDRPFRQIEVPNTASMPSIIPCGTS